METYKRELINDIINNVLTNKELITHHNYIVMEDCDNEYYKLIEIGTTLPRALSIKNEENSDKRIVLKLLDDDNLIYDELKNYIK